jgi:glycosyltransferase AglD
MIEFTVALPCYNEEETLESAVRTVLHKFQELGKEVYIIISEDGSTDRTMEIGKALEEEFSNVSFIRGSHQRLGKGASVSKAIRAAKTPYVIFMDCDLSNDLGNIAGLIEGLREGYDLVLGSKAHKDSVVRTPILRTLASKAFNLLVRVLFKLKIRDTQCGFKGFKRESALAVLDRVENTGWFWDVEMLVRMSGTGYRVKEVPTSYIDLRPDSKLCVVRDGRAMGRDAIAFWKKLRKEGRK